MQYDLTERAVAEYLAYLRERERSEATIERYLRAVRAFMRYLRRRPVSRALIAQWKRTLLEQGCAPSSINASLAALNGLFGMLGWSECRTKFLKVQRRMFRDPEKELSREEYTRLVRAAQRKNDARLALVLEAICATGIRVSEVRYLTVEAARRGRAAICLKGKLREILLPEKLCRALLRYAAAHGIGSGEIFLSARGGRLSRGQIWAEMKSLCADANVSASKVFPHNLRHLFAVVFYRQCRDIARLADVLGHSSIETTRIYLLRPCREQKKQLDGLHLVL